MNHRISVLLAVVAKMPFLQRIFNSIRRTTESPNELANVDIEEEHLPFIIKDKPDKQTQTTQYSLSWIIFAWLLVFTLALLFIRERTLERQVSTPLGTFASGFSTEFGKLIKEILACINNL